MSLPGVKTIINDRFYVLSRTVATGPSVAIIGRRTTADKTSDGEREVADLDVYQAPNEKRVIEAFGDGSDLHRGYLEAAAGGATRVLLVPLPSDTVFDHVTPELTSTSYTTGGGTDLFESAFAAVEAAQADVVVPWGRGAGPTEFQSPATPGDDAEFGFHADNSSTANTSWAKLISDRVAQITANSHPCFAVMGIKPYLGDATEDGGMTPGQVSTHLGLTNLTDHNVKGSEIPESDPVLHTGGMGVNGVYLQVVTAEITPLGYNDNTEYGFSNGAAMYAGHAVQMDPWSAPTGKSIFNVERVRYNPTRTQQLALIEQGVVPVSLNFQRTPTWVDAQTFGLDASDYKRLTTLRITFAAIEMVRRVAQGFIGEGANIEQRNALETAITSGLRGMQQSGALLASDFAVTYIAYENKAIVDLVLTPAFELRNIEVSVAVQLA